MSVRVYHLAVRACLAVAALSLALPPAHAQPDKRIQELERRFQAKGDFWVWDMEIQSKRPVRASEVIARAQARQKLDRAR